MANLHTAPKTLAYARVSDPAPRLQRPWLNVHPSRVTQSISVIALKINSWVRVNSISSFHDTKDALISDV